MKFLIISLVMFALSARAQFAVNIATNDASGLPDGWIIAMKPTSGTNIPSGFVAIMTQSEIDAQKQALAAPYAAWVTKQLKLQRQGDDITTQINNRVKVLLGPKTISQVTADLILLDHARVVGTATQADIDASNQLSVLLKQIRDTQVKEAEFRSITATNGIIDWSTVVWP